MGGNGAQRLGAVLEDSGRGGGAIAMLHEGARQP
jgi:hypothetical protein